VLCASVMNVLMSGALEWRMWDLSPLIADVIGLVDPVNGTDCCTEFLVNELLRTPTLDFM
jgi:hypothetical protein